MTEPNTGWWITPVPVDYISDSVFQESNLFVHKKFEFIYCAVCRSGILMRLVVLHMRSHNVLVAKDQLLLSFQKLTNSKRFPVTDLGDSRISSYFEGSPMPPINGVPVQLGFKCTVDGCNFCSKSKNTIRGYHHQKYHPTVRPIKKEKCFIQDLFNVRKYSQVQNGKY